MIDFETSENTLLANPRLGLNSEELLNHFEEVHLEMRGHVLIATSGSMSEQFKWVALSWKALRVSAESVNKWIQANEKDIWFQCLPRFHIGGLAIYARSQLSRSQVCDFTEKWNVESFVSFVEKQECTLGSLVPTQIYDLVKAQKRAPASLRGIFVGGGALSEDLYQKARDLGWPLYLTYGCSEAASQVATSRLGEQEIRVLEHVEAGTHCGNIKLRGPSLLSGYFVKNEGAWSFVDPKQEGWFLTEDFGEVHGGRLVCRGRSTRVVKVLGENVNLDSLQNRFEKYSDMKIGEFAVVAVEDERRNHELVLVSTSSCRDLIGKFNELVLPFERVSRALEVGEIPKSDLGKIKYAELKKRVIHYEI